MNARSRRMVIGYGLLGCLLGAGCLQAADYSDLTTNLPDYYLSNQTDTWTRCLITNVLTTRIAAEPGSVAEVGYIASTNQCYLPVSSSYRQNNVIGFAGPGTVWASNSMLRMTYMLDVGLSNNGVLRLTDSTLQFERDPNTGIFTARLGYGVTATGEWVLVNSRLFYNNPAYPYGCQILLGRGGSQTGTVGRVWATNSSLGPIERFNLYGHGSLAWFDSTTATLYQCSIGGNVAGFIGNGDMTLTNGSLLKMPRTITANTSNLYVGVSYNTIAYTSTLTVAGSRVENFGCTFVGCKSTGRGRLSFTGGAVGLLSNLVVLGVDHANAAGYLDIADGSAVTVHNTNETCVMMVGQTGFGQLWLDGGTCRVDCLYLTNGVKSVLAISNGMLSVKHAVVSNDTPVVIGDGAGQATLDQWGGGTATVYGALAFTNNSRWRVDMDTGADEVLDVRGTLAFADGAAFDPATTNTYASLDGRRLAVADAVASVPDVPLAGGRLKVTLEDAGGGRQALVLNLVRGTIFNVR